MIHIKTDWDIPYYNMALESMLVNEDLEDDYFFFYVNAPSVIIGKNQNTLAEINPSFIKENNIHVARRLTGGGAVYHDKGNLNYSFIVRGSTESIDFRKYTQPVIDALTKLGIKCELSGRNDILIEGRKISGNAQLVKKDRVLHHGTLMVDVDINNMLEALNVSELKIESKAIKSVRSRVANISEYLNKDFTVTQLRDFLLEEFYASAKFETLTLDDEAIAKINESVETVFSTWEHNYARSPESNITKMRKFTAGIVEARFIITGGLFTHMKFFGDYFFTKETSEFEALLIGRKYKREDIENLLGTINISDYFLNLTGEEFISLLFD